MSKARALIAFAATLVIMQLAPLPVYGAFSAAGLVELPSEGSPAQFFTSILVIHAGVALGFVLLYRPATPALAGRWWPYAATWWAMYAVVEVGQAIGPGYSAAEAIAGIISEALYFPVSGVVVARLIGAPSRR